ncbi:MAG: cupredoxin domain-containing protein [Actinomycetota bacterium]|jgi:plastocyanin
MNGRVQRTLLLSSLFLAAMPFAPAEAGGGCHADPNSAETMAGTEVEMQRNCFRPAVLAVEEGATVRFTNHDQINHVVVGTQWAVPGEITPGGSAEHRFLRRGTYPYACYLHPGMNGVVLVGDPAPAAPAQLAASGPSSGGSNLPPLTFGALAGLTAGVAGSAWRRRRVQG